MWVNLGHMLKCFGYDTLASGEQFLGFPEGESREKYELIDEVRVNCHTFSEDLERILQKAHEEEAAKVKAEAKE